MRTASGTSPYTWLVSSGTLPAGLSLSTGGVISGTPATANATGVSVIVQATDANNCVTTKGYTFKVCPVLSLHPSHSALGHGGHRVPAADDRRQQRRGPLHLLLDQRHDAARAHPQQHHRGAERHADHREQRRGSEPDDSGGGPDFNGCPGTIIYNLKICPVLTFTPRYAARRAPSGTNYSQAIAANAGTTPYALPRAGMAYAYALTNGTCCPPDLPWARTARWAARPPPPTARERTSRSRPLTQTVVPARSPISAQGHLLRCWASCPAAVANGTVGTAYSQSVIASGGAAPYAYSLSSGTLPAGLSMSSAGVISGTPTTANAGGANITVKATDVNGCPATINYTLKICPVLTITPASLGSGIVGTAYNQTLTASNGTAPYTWSVISGSLPPGLALSSAGAIEWRAHRRRYLHGLHRRRRRCEWLPWFRSLHHEHRLSACDDQPWLAVDRRPGWARRTRPV